MPVMIIRGVFLTLVVGVCFGGASRSVNEGVETSREVKRSVVSSDWLNKGSKLTNEGVVREKTLLEVYNQTKDGSLMKFRDEKVTKVMDSFDGEKGGEQGSGLVKEESRVSGVVEIVTKVKLPLKRSDEEGLGGKKIEGRRSGWNVDKPKLVKHVLREKTPKRRLYNRRRTEVHSGRLRPHHVRRSRLLREKGRNDDDGDVANFEEQNRDEKNTNKWNVREGRILKHSRTIEDQGRHDSNFDRDGSGRGRNWNRGRDRERERYRSRYWKDEEEDDKYGGGRRREDDSNEDDDDEQDDEEQFRMWKYGGRKERNWRSPISRAEREEEREEDEEMRRYWRNRERDEEDSKPRKIGRKESRIYRITTEDDDDFDDTVRNRRQTGESTIGKLDTNKENRQNNDLTSILNRFLRKVIEEIKQSGVLSNASDGNEKKTNRSEKTMTSFNNKDGDGLNINWNRRIREELDMIKNKRKKVWRNDWNYPKLKKKQLGQYLSTFWNRGSRKKVNDTNKKEGMEKENDTDLNLDSNDGKIEIADPSDHIQRIRRTREIKRRKSEKNSKKIYKNDNFRDVNLIWDDPENDIGESENIHRLRNSRRIEHGGQHSNMFQNNRVKEQKNSRYLLRSNNFKNYYTNRFPKKQNDSERNRNGFDKNVESIRNNMGSNVYRGRRKRSVFPEMFQARGRHVRSRREVLDEGSKGEIAAMEAKHRAMVGSVDRELTSEQGPQLKRVTRVVDETKMATAYGVFQNRSSSEMSSKPPLSEDTKMATTSQVSGDRTKMASIPQIPEGIPRIKMATASQVNNSSKMASKPPISEGYSTTKMATASQELQNKSTSTIRYETIAPTSSVSQSFFTTKNTNVPRVFENNTKSQETSKSSIPESIPSSKMATTPKVLQNKSSSKMAPTPQVSHGISIIKMTNASRTFENVISFNTASKTRIPEGNFTAKISATPQVLENNGSSKITSEPRVSDGTASNNMANASQVSKLSPSTKISVTTSRINDGRPSTKIDHASHMSENNFSKMASIPLIVPISRVSNNNYSSKMVSKQHASESESSSKMATTSRISTNHSSSKIVSKLPVSEGKPTTKMAATSRVSNNSASPKLTTKSRISESILRTKMAKTSWVSKGSSNTKILSTVSQVTERSPKTKMSAKFRTFDNSLYSKMAATPSRIPKDESRIDTAFTSRVSEGNLRTKITSKTLKSEVTSRTKLVSHTSQVSENVSTTKASTSHVKISSRPSTPPSSLVPEDVPSSKMASNTRVSDSSSSLKMASQPSRNTSNINMMVTVLGPRFTPNISTSAKLNGENEVVLSRQPNEGNQVMEEQEMELKIEVPTRKKDEEAKVTPFYLPEINKVFEDPRTNKVGFNLTFEEHVQGEMDFDIPVLTFHVGAPEEQSTDESAKTIGYEDSLQTFGEFEENIDDSQEISDFYEEMMSNFEEFSNEGFVEEKIVEKVNVSEQKGNGEGSFMKIIKDQEGIGRENPQGNNVKRGEPKLKRRRKRQLKKEEKSEDEEDYEEEYEEKNVNWTYGENMFSENLTENFSKVVLGL